jgi:hypothetical protein
MNFEDYKKLRIRSIRKLATMYNNQLLEQEEWEDHPVERIKEAVFAAQKDYDLIKNIEHEVVYGIQTSLWHMETKGNA